ncbi:hypothetical protein ACJMK2_025183, partial [Sinanodonta woodiana]
SQVCNVFLVTGIYGVPDEYLSASSEYNAHHAAKYGRINTAYVKGSNIGAWAAGFNRNNEFIQVQLNQLSLIQAIQTQGKNGTGDPSLSNQYVKSYYVSYRKNNTSWLYIMDSTGNKKLFPGNNDQNSIKANQLECPLEAQYIRINVWEYEEYPSMRFDLTGCLLTEDNCSLLALITQNYPNSNVTFRSTNLIRFIPRSSTPRYLRVWSTVKNIASAYINVSVIGCSHQSRMVSSKVVNISEHGWTPVAVDVRHTDYQLSINGGWKAGDQGYLAIDHVLLFTGICP